MPKRNKKQDDCPDSGAYDGRSSPVVGATAQPAPDPSFFPSLSTDNVNYANLLVLLHNGVV